LRSMMDRNQIWESCKWQSDIYLTKEFKFRF
jgi:hypothetical protein